MQYEKSRRGRISELNETMPAWIPQTMLQPCLTPGKTGLLVSVRSVVEAKITQSSGCVSIIDLKEPNAGSLGCVSFETAQEICRVLSYNCEKSIALGEATEGPLWPTQKLVAQHDLLSKFRFAKVGLSGLANEANWVQQWHDRIGIVPDCVQRVAVAYADNLIANSPPIDAVIDSAKTVGCSILLVDTFQKGQGGLLDLIPVEKLKTIVNDARKQDLKVVLAGSLQQKDIALVKSLAPDFIAVRGAACAADRTSMLDLNRIKALGQLVIS